MKKTALLLALLTVFFSLTSCGYNCETCHDETKIVCSDCNGEKEILCSWCGGDGFVPCALCNGTGSRSCIYCGGLGSKWEYDYYTNSYQYKSCYMCTFGKMSCLSTSPCSCIDGKTDCNTCTAQGEIDCPDC